LLIPLEFADMLLGVELNAQLLDQRQLRLEEIDVLLLIGRKRFEQVPRNPVVNLLAMAGGFQIEFTSARNPESPSRFCRS
jgi:hypothetical protein